MLTGRVALVTSVTHFVGTATATELAAQGATVVCQDTSFADDAARDAFAAANAGPHTTAAQEPGEIAAEIAGAHGSVDVLVNNDAFPAIRAKVEDADPDDMRAGLEAMITRPLMMSAAVVPAMKERGRGEIIFATSAAPFRGLPNYSMYVAARGGANSLALSLAKELAPHGIQVNAIAPNFVESPTYFPEKLLADPAALAKITSNIPLGRLGKPQEAAALIAFLASDRADFITAQVIPFAGGWA